MKVQKATYTLFILVLALSIIAASSQATLSYSIKKGETKAFPNGRAGVVFSKSQLNGTVTMKRMSDSARIPGGNKPEFRTDLLDARFVDTGHRRITHVLGAVYVYFIVRQVEARLFQKGDLAIYWYDTWKGDWVKCSTYAVVDRGVVTSLGCRMRVFGLYGLAYTE